MTIVVDASVAAKWYFNEPGHQGARALFARGEEFAAPSLLLLEVANVVWKRFKRGEITREDAREIVRLTPLAFSEIVPIEALVPQATTIAMDAGHPIYDCIYFALAVRDGLSLVTSDERMQALGRRIKVRVELVR